MIIEADRGRWLVTGAPGTGKTRALRQRFVALVQGGADPERIALFVLTRRAAREARDRIAGALTKSLPGLPVLTSHGYAFGLLNRRGAELEYDGEPVVLAAADQYAAVRELLAGEDPSVWPRFGHLLNAGGFAREVADFVLRAQERLLEPEDLPQDDEVVAFYRRYKEVQALHGRTDFAGLLGQAAKLLQDKVGDDDRFDHLLVDDYQDATPALEAIVAALAPQAVSVCIAADPEGHVFSYRGGTIEPLQRIEQTLPGLAGIELAETTRAGVTQARLFAHPGEEADSVAHELLAARVDEDVPWERMAVVVRRYGGYLPALRHALTRHNVPHVVVGEAAAIAAEPAVAPVLDLLRYALRPERRDDLVEPVLASPAGGLDPHRLRALRREARLKAMTVRELVEAGSLTAPDLREAVDRLRDLVALIVERAHDDPSALFFEIWSRLPSSAQLVAEERHRDLDALAALGDILRRFGESRPGAVIGEWLDVIEAADFGPDPWVPPEERRPAAVRITTAHRAHGSEFDIVCVAGCVEGEFPTWRPRMPLVDLDDLTVRTSEADRRAAWLAEERRLFRLATSRATRRTVLFASESPSWRNPRTPSRYVDSLGLAWTVAAEQEGPQSSLRSIEAALRRTLADASANAEERIAALAALQDAGADPGAWWGGRDWTENTAPLHEGEITTSYSRLSTLENCGLQYLYDKEMGLDTEQGSAAWLGSLVHDIIQRVHEGAIERTPEALKAALDERWEPDMFAGRAVERQRYRDALGMLERWRIHDPPNPIKAEVEFKFPIEGATLRGRIDAVYKQSNGHLRIVDYKTGRSYPTKEELKDDLQLAAYWLATLRTPELAALGAPGMVELAYVALERQRTGFLKLSFSPKTEPGYEERVEGRIKDLLEIVRDERFAPNAEADCKWCRFKTICPLWTQGKDAAAP